jgi:DNA-binding winged helix-turn-helix (wHTH) protein
MTDFANSEIDEQESSNEYSLFSEAEDERAIAFGPFRLLTRQWLLLEGDTQVHIGSRALEILIALVKRPGALVGRRELMRQVWPDTVVTDANLTVQIAALRRALRDGKAGGRYIVNIPGRGYQFVAPITVGRNYTGARLSPSGYPRALPAPHFRRTDRAEGAGVAAELLPA